MQVDLESILVKETFEYLSDKEILRRLFEKYCPEIDAYTHVEEVSSFGIYVSNNARLYNVITDIASLAEARWFIKGNKLYYMKK
ncbi:MAG: hypothetical protein JEZ06_04310 [Anaerolineaceae bacterium]|nr:hypothetical protein [Anaerolineaceae bacterium]